MKQYFKYDHFGAIILAEFFIIGEAFVTNNIHWVVFGGIGLYDHSVSRFVILSSRNVGVVLPSPAAMRCLPKRWQKNMSVQGGRCPRAVSPQQKKVYGTSWF